MISIEEKVPSKIPGVTSLFITTPYNKDVLAVIKGCTPLNYDKKVNTWEIPTTRLAKFLNGVKGIDDIKIKLKKDKLLKEQPDVKLSNYKTKPYTYQEEGIQFGLKHPKWLLLDMPGLGKTLQLIYLAQELKKRDGIKHCLIVCGLNTLKANWEKEIAKHSNLSCRVLGKRITKNGNIVYGSIPERLAELKKPLKEFFLITNIETLRDDKIIKELRNGKNKFEMIALDEAHVIKSPTSQQSRNLLKLNAPHMIAMTGTLLLNNPLDAYVPLKWIGAEHSTYTNFRCHYTQYGGLFGIRMLTI